MLHLKATLGIRVHQVKKGEEISSYGTTSWKCERALCGEKVNMNTVRVENKKKEDQQMELRSKKPCQDMVTTEVSFDG